MTSLAGRPEVMGAVLVLVALLAVPFRIASEARSELDAANDALALGETTRAIDHFRRALRWKLPFASTGEMAIAGLEAIASEREAEGDREGALLAWRSIVGGLSATRTVFGTDDAAMARAKNEITRLAVPADEASRYRALLDREIAPDPFGAVLLVVGFLLWLCSLLILIRRGFDHLGRLDLASARTPLLGAAAGFTSFVIGLLFA